MKIVKLSLYANSNILLRTYFLLRSIRILWHTLICLLGFLDPCSGFFVKMWSWAQSKEILRVRRGV